MITPNRPDEHKRIIESIARESRAPIDEVAQLYEYERAAFETSSRLKTFVPIFVIRKVRELLRQRASGQPIPGRAGEILDAA